MMLSSPLDLALFLMVLRVELQGVTSFIFFFFVEPSNCLGTSGGSFRNVIFVLSGSIYTDLVLTKQ